MTIFAIIAYLLLVCGLLFVAYSKKYFCYYTLAKGICSGGFIALVLIFYLGAKPSFFGNIYFLGLLIAFIFCLLGDVFLGLANNKGKLFSRYFLRGVILFMLAHTAFCITFYTISPFKIYDLILPIIAATGTFLISNNNFFKFTKMKYPAIVYSLFVGLMCTKGFSIAVQNGFKGVSLFVVIGSILFLISDATIILLYFFKKPRKSFRAINLATYYIGLLFLAISVGA